MKLKTLYGYDNASDTEKKKICNGCGPSGGWKEKIIPDTIWGLNINPACAIHDWGYHFGTSDWDKERVDLMFLENMNIMISNASWWFRWLRRRRALKYYWAVKYFGKKAFMANKEGTKYVALTKEDIKDPKFLEFCKVEEKKAIQEVA